MKKIEFVGEDLKKVKFNDSDLSETESLIIWRCTGVDFSILEKTKNLEVLEITNYPYESLVNIEQNKKLRKIRMIGIPELNDITSLKSFKELISLSIETSPSWDSQKKFAKIKDLTVLFDLPNLEDVSICGFDIDNFDQDMFLDKCTAKKIRISGTTNLKVSR